MHPHLRAQLRELALRTGSAHPELGLLLRLINDHYLTIDNERRGIVESMRLMADEARALALEARELCDGPTFAHGMTKTMLSQEWAMTIDQAIEAEAQAQAICMQTEDFRRAYEAFSSKRKPVFEGD